MKRTKADKVFIKVVTDFYCRHGRHDLPWRQNTDPYRVFISELMLQQTQVSQVVPKYQAFLKRFPTTAALSKAELREVLTLWQGLGYNRRAKYVHAAAKQVMSEYSGRWPKTVAGLRRLPGVGPYTAAAIAVFSFNQPVVMIETNIRTVFLYHFFKQTSNVPDTELLPIIERTLPTKDARTWYAALMDYGSYLKVMHGNQNKRSAEFSKQTAFEGSDRQIRGAILRCLLTNKTGLTKLKLARTLPEFPVGRVNLQLQALVADGLVKKVATRYFAG